MLLQVLVLILGVVSLVTSSWGLFTVAGVGALLIDGVGFLSGKLNPIMPVIFYFLGFQIMGSFWEGLFLGALAGNALDLIILFIGTASTKHD